MVKQSYYGSLSSSPNLLAVIMPWWEGGSRMWINAAIMDEMSRYYLHGNLLKNRDQLWGPEAATVVPHLFATIQFLCEFNLPHASSPNGLPQHPCSRGAVNCCFSWSRGIMVLTRLAIFRWGCLH